MKWRVKKLMGLNIKSIINENVKEKEICGVELKRLQHCLLTLYGEIYEACKKHHFHLSSVFGTTLGAVRHQGFIPWDDDIDLALRRDEYNRFSEVYETELKDRYEISYPHGKYHASNRFIQLFRKGTVLKTSLNEKYEHRMICIDIFPIDYVPENFTLRFLKGNISNFLMGIAGCVTDVEYGSDFYRAVISRSVKGNAIYHLRQVVGHLFSFYDANTWYHIVDKSVQWKKSRFCGCMMGWRHYFGECNVVKVWYPLKKVKFEDTEIYIPNMADKYLEAMYGENYMELPPENKRQSHFAEELGVFECEI